LNRCFKFLYCKILFLLYFTPVSSQELSGKTFTTKDGLPSSFILNTYQDKPGYLWIGTVYGLSRFDGKNFTNFGFTEGLPDLRTDAMLMDKKMRFWAGTRRGIALLKGNKFISYPVSDSLQISYVFNFLETKEGQIWSLTYAGVYEFANDKWQKKDLYPGYENKPCKGIIETGEGMYINYGNIIILKKNNGSFKIIGPYHKEGYYYNTLSRSGAGLFISTADGLCKIKNETLEKLPGALGKLQGVYSYFIDSKKMVCNIYLNMIPWV
jgi:ligand-binding sensor domain-containing protein